MNRQRRAVADEMLAAARAHDAAQSDRLARFRNVEPETTELLALLVRATRPRRCAPEFVRALRPDGGLLAIDNVLSHAAEVADVTALIAAEPAVMKAPVPVGAGVRLVVRASR